MTMSAVFMPNSLRAWGTADFRAAFKREAEQLDPTLLPLQQALAISNRVSDRPICIIPLATEETLDSIRIKSGISYAGIIAGCSCADDPTPVDELTEYCEVWFKISKTTAAATVVLLID